MTDPRVEHARHHFLARYTVNGVLAADFVEVTASIERWADWCRAWSARAAVHEQLGRDALAAGANVSAGEHLQRAAVYYHYAKYLFVQDMAQHRAAHAKAVECHTLALPHLDPPGERVLIPYQGKHLAAVLRKPANVARAPVVLMTMGLDSTKEEWDSFALTFLKRGMATLAFDGPGQGEAEYDFPIRIDYENVVGPVIDWVEARAHARGDLDAERIGVWGVSLGGYYAPRAAAFEPRIKACIANGGPWNWGALWSKLPELTKAAYIVRTHSKTEDEARRHASTLTLEGVADKITCPLYVIAAGLDRLCPPEDARRLADAARGPVELVVIEDGNHVAHNRPYRYRPQSADWMSGRLGA